MNIDQGDSSRKPAAADFSNLEPSLVAAASEAAGVATDAAPADGACAVGAAGGEIAAGCDAAGACCAMGADICCADDGDSGDSIASATITPQAA
jgi:hypothetical protein